MIRSRPVTGARSVGAMLLLARQFKDVFPGSSMSDHSTQLRPRSAVSHALIYVLRAPLLMRSVKCRDFDVRQSFDSVRMLFLYACVGLPTKPESKSKTDIADCIRAQFGVRQVQ